MTTSEGSIGSQPLESREKEPVPEEIERKFLVRSLPENIDQYPKKEIIQGYLAITSDGTEVRLRKKGDKYFQTVKSGSGKTRFESEIEMSEEQFNMLWSGTEGRRVHKTRYEIPYEQSTIELDVYHGDHDGLLSAEIEFESEEASNQFTPPEWMSEEVTDDKRYKNQNLALYGVPEATKYVPEQQKEELNIPIFDLESGVQKLTSMVREKLTEVDRPLIVEVAGGSASGKTSAVAKKIKDIFGDSAMIFSMDNYYRGRTYMAEQAAQGNVLNFDQPEVLKLPLVKEHLATLKQGQPVDVPIYDFKVCEAVGSTKVEPKNVIIVEGLFALDPQLEGEGDIKAFVDIGTHGRILRRIMRDVTRTGQKPVDILKYFAEVVEPMHDKYIESTKKNADLIIINEYAPEIEAERSGLQEIQMKFRGEIDPETLRKLGAEKISSTVQVDNYYDPKDRNLAESGEVLRIREEGSERTLTYKGPAIESEFRQRPKLEFVIDPATEKAFLDIYGEMNKVISKERVLYQLDGVVFSLDNVRKTEDGKTTELGKFIEIRSTDKQANMEQVRAVIEKLGLDINQGIKLTYHDM